MKHRGAKRRGAEMLWFLIALCARMPAQWKLVKTVKFWLILPRIRKFSLPNVTSEKTSKMAYVSIYRPCWFVWALFLIKRTSLLIMYLFFLNKTFFLGTVFSNQILFFWTLLLVCSYPSPPSNQDDVVYERTLNLMIFFSSLTKSWEVIMLNNVHLWASMEFNYLPRINVKFLKG